jgi:biopolymer transport protein ExbB/TolQ/biopolymer transport protein ExbD
MNIAFELARAFAPNQDGYLFMWVLAFIAVAAVVIVLERWLIISSRTNVDPSGLVNRLQPLIVDNRLDEAMALCTAGGTRSLPRVLGAGIAMARRTPQLIRSAMEEETLHMVSLLERRADILLMLGNVSTLLGLMGTIYGLIISFAAVARPDVAAVEKSSLLAAGISTAMNTTLLGLLISVPCIMVYSFLHARISSAVHEIDRCALSILRALQPQEIIQKDLRLSSRRFKQEVDTEPNIAPMMNLMVILIPLLLTSAEFVKIGAIEIKLPQAEAGGQNGGQEDEQQLPALRLDAGIAITAQGFNVFDYFSIQSGAADSAALSSGESGKVQIPLKDGKYDYEALNARLADCKRQALLQILRTIKSDIPDKTELYSLGRTFENNRQRLQTVQLFEDHEDIKVVAEDKISYQTVVAVMDAARGTRTPHGDVSLFPNVSLAGGIVR